MIHVILSLQVCDDPRWTKKEAEATTPSPRIRLQAAPERNVLQLDLETVTFLTLPIELPFKRSVSHHQRVNLTRPDWQQQPQQEQQLQQQQQQQHLQLQQQ